MRRFAIPLLASAAAHAAVLAVAASFVPGDIGSTPPAIAVELVTVPAIRPPAPVPASPPPAEAVAVAAPAPDPPPRVSRPVPVRPRAVPAARTRAAEAVPAVTARAAALAPAPTRAPVEAPASEPAAAEAVPAAPVPPSAPATPVAAGESSGEPSGAPPAAVAMLGVARSPVAYASNPKPAYPAIARARGLEGRVVLRVSVGEDGAPGDIVVARSSGYPLLDGAAREGVARWRFSAASVDGRTVPGTIDVPVVFRLDD